MKSDWPNSETPQLKQWRLINLIRLYYCPSQNWFYFMIFQSCQREGGSLSTDQSSWGSPWDKPTNQKWAKYDFRWDQPLSQHFTFTRGSRRFAEGSAGRWNLPNPFLPSGCKELQKSQNSADLTQNCRIIPTILMGSEQYLSSEGWQHPKLHCCHISFPFCLATTSALLWAPDVLATQRQFPTLGIQDNFPLLGGGREALGCDGSTCLSQHRQAEWAGVSVHAQPVLGSCFSPADSRNMHMIFAKSLFTLTPNSLPYYHQVLFNINTKIFAILAPNSSSPLPH